MKRKWRRSICVFLSFLLCLQTPAFGHDQQLAERAVEAHEFDALVKNSEQMPAGQPRGSFAPDRFLLLEQEVVARNYVGRSFSFFSNVIERELEEHYARLNRGRKVIAQIQALRKALNDESAPARLRDVSAQKVEADLLDHIDNGRVADHPVFIWDGKADAELLSTYEYLIQEIVTGWETQLHSLSEVKESLTEVPNVTKAPTHRRDRLYNWWDVSVNVLEKDGSVADVIELHKFADHRSAVGLGEGYSCSDGDTCRFTLKSNKGLELNRFHIPTKAIAALGPYVVFVHENSYSAEEGIQYLSFLDLSNYGPSLGSAEIPVFRLPVLMDEPVSSLEVRPDGLKLNGKDTIPVETFVAASEMQQAAFNITANFVDPESIADLHPYITSIETLFEKIIKHEVTDALGEKQATESARVLLQKLGQDIVSQLKQNKSLAEFAAGKKTQVSDEEMAEFPEEVRKNLERYGDQIAKSEELNKRLETVSKRISYSRLLRAKVKAFFNRITSPVPNASLKIKRALVLVGAKKDIEQGRIWSFLLDRPFLQSSFILASMLSFMAPESAYALMQGGLAIGNGIFDYLKFALLGISEAAYVGTKATLSPFLDLAAPFTEHIDSKIYKQYIADGNLFKTLVGMSTYVPFVLGIYYIFHLIFNAHKIFIDYREPDWNGFVDHQKKFFEEYYQRLANDEAKRRKLTEEKEGQVKYSDEEIEEIKQWVEQRKSTSPAYNPGFLTRAWRSTKDALGKLVGKRWKLRDDGLWKALLGVTFSFPAMELTLSRWARFWNWFAGMRFNTVGFLTLKDLGLKYNMPIFVRLKPITASVRLAFPDFFNTVVAKGGPKLTLPTQLNGGTRFWGVRDGIWLKEALLGRSSAQVQMEQEVERELTRSELKAVTENFEDSIIDVENAVYQVAFRAALKRLPEFIANKDEILAIFKDKPLKSVVEKRVGELPVKVRTFLRLFFEEVYIATMTDYLDQMIARDENDEAAVKMTPAQMKKWILEMRRRTGDKSPFAFDPAQAAAIAARHGERQDIFERVSKQAKKGEFSLKNWLTNRKFNVVADMDPEQNGSMKRFSVVQERLKSPNALSRAVRAEISKLLVTFPLDMAFKLFFAAGIFEGAYKPIQDELWGPNSVFYLSRDSFYMITASGFAMSMMADVWVKLQQDQRQDDMGDFGLVPKGEDAEKSFVRWYAKQFNAKNNSLLANWAFANKIAFWNIPAALANIGLFNYMFSGRLDLSYLLGIYVVGFGTPFSALYYKVDQAFERSAEYAARGIPDEKWLAHPLVREVVTHESQYYRNRFQLLSDAYQNMQNNWLLNVQMIPTSYGTKGFLRSVFGGPLVEEAIVEKVLMPLKGITHNIPVVGPTVEWAAGLCEHVLTNNNTDLRIKR